MARIYKYDADLEFLKSVPNQHLNQLVDYIVGPSSNRRLNEQLTSQPEYAAYWGAHYSNYYKEIIHELQLYGGNTVANLFRGKQGVLYEEILTDVCKKLKVPVESYMSVRNKEKRLLETVFLKTLSELSEQELKEMANEWGLESTLAKSMGKPALLAAFQGAINSSGFAPYKMSVIIANAMSKALVGHGLAFKTNYTLTKSLGILVGPIGIAFTVGWLALILGSPAYRVTIPACIHIAYLRSAYVSLPNWKTYIKKYIAVGVLVSSIAFGAITFYTHNNKSATLPNSTTIAPVSKSEDITKLIDKKRTEDSSNFDSGTNNSSDVSESSRHNSVPGSSPVASDIANNNNADSVPSDVYPTDSSIKPTEETSVESPSTSSSSPSKSNEQTETPGSTPTITINEYKMNNSTIDQILRSVFHLGYEFSDFSSPYKINGVRSVNKEHLTVSLQCYENPSDTASMILNVVFTGSGIQQSSIDEITNVILVDPSDEQLKRVHSLYQLVVSIQDWRIEQSTDTGKQKLTFSTAEPINN